MQGTIIAFVILLLFRLRRRLGLGVLYACIGLFQFVQFLVFILNTVFDSEMSKFLVSPGSSVFITITLFSLLIIYIKQDAGETKKMIFAVLIVNVLISILLAVFGWNMEASYMERSLTTPNHFIFSPRILIVGNLVLFLDSLLLIIIFEYISKKTKFLFVQILVTMLLIVTIDTLLFATITFWNLDNLGSIIQSGLIAKNSFAFYYSIIFYIYLRYLDETDRDLVYFNINDVFKPLTYKQKFEAALTNIKKSEEIYRIITDNSYDIICLLDLDGIYKYISPSIKTILGYNQSDFLGKNIFNIVHKDDFVELKKNIANKSFKNNENTYTIRLLHKNGHYLSIEYTIAPIYKNNKITSFVSSARDVTKRVNAYHQFKRSSELLKIREHFLNESSKIGKIGFAEYNNDSQSFTWSDYLYTLFEVEKTDKLPTHEEFLSYFDEASQLKLKKGVAKLYTEGKPIEEELKAVNTSGKEIWIAAIINPIYDSNNKIIGRRAVVQDITAQKLRQIEIDAQNKELSKLNSNLNEAQKLGKLGSWEYILETNTLTWSKELFRIFELSDKLKPPKYADQKPLYTASSFKLLDKAVIDCAENGTPYNLELDIITSKGTKKHIISRGRALKDNNNNNIFGYYGTMQDITTSKKAQLELVESKQEIENSLNLLKEKENFLKQTSKIAKIGYWQYQIKSDNFTWSNYVFTIYELNPKNKIPSRKEILEFYDKNSKDLYEKATKNLEFNGIPCDLELKIINAKKEEVWVRVVVQLIRDKNNNITGKQGVIQDITETKKARIALEKSNLKIKNSIELIKQKERSLQETRKIAQLGYSEYIYKTESYIWTDYMYTIFGLDPNSEIPKRDELIALHDEESLIKLHKATEKLETEGTPYDIELKLINFKKEEVWIRIVAHLIYTPQNEIIGRSGVFQDITAYKTNQIKLESYLKQLEKKEIDLKESNKIANIGYWEYYFEDENISSSNYVYKIYGLEPNQEIPKREEIMKLYDKPSLEKLKEATIKLMTDGKPYDIETKLTNFKNEEIWTRSIVQPIFDKNNKIIGRRGLVQNITEYKKTQIALETSLELLAKKELSLKDSSKIAGIGYIEYDYAKNIYTDYSEYIYTIFGINHGEEVATKEEALRYFDEESKIKFLQGLNDVKNGKISDIELRGKNRKNEEIWIRSVSSPIFNDKNEVVKRRVVLQNIKNYKKTQQELQESLKLLKQKDLSLKDSSRIAGIGFAEYNYKNNVYTASKYIFDLFGVDYNDKFSEKDLVHFFDRESQLKYIQAIEDFRKNGTNYDIELKGKNQKNEDIWLRSVGSPIYNDKGDELLGRRIVLQDIKNYKKNQLELEQSKQEIQNSLDLIKDKDDTLKESNKIANIGYWEYDFNNDTFVWSNYIYKIFGLNPQQKIPSRESLIDYYDEESKEKIKVATQNLITHGVPYDIELRLINANNEETWTRNVVHLVFNHKNEVIARRGLMQNITAYKKAQKEIKESFKLLERRKFAIDEASKIAKIGYYEYDVATDNLIWSEHLYRIYGLDPNKPVPYINEIFSLIDKESIPIVKQAIEDLKQKGKPYDIEFKVLNKKKNKEVWVRSVTQPVYNNNNKIIGRRGVVQDITTQRNNQIELEKKNKEIINSLKLLERSEYSKNEASKVAKIGYHKYYTITKTFYWSDYMYTIFGVEAGQKIPKREELLELFLKESRKKLIKATNDLETYGIPYDLELKLINFKGEDAWLRISNHPIYDTNKTKIIGRRGVAQDITERKKIEEEHLKVKKDYIRLFDNATISIWNEDLTLLFKEISRLKKLKIKNIAVYLEQNPELLFTLINKIKVKYVNKATLKLFKAQNEQEFFKNLSLTFGDEAEKVFIKLIEAVWNNADTFTSEVKYKTIEGDQFTAILSVAIPKTIKEQKTVPVSIQSIQSIKDAEFALKESLTKLKEAQKLGRLGNFEVNPITEQFTWSDEIYNIFDFDPKNGFPSYEAILNTVHPDDLEYHNQKIDDALNKGIPFDFEFRIITPKKVEKHLRLICELVKNDQGKVILLKGINQDITEHKKIINEIEKTQEMYRLVTDNTNDLIFLHDIDGRIIYTSPSVTELLGYDNLEYSRPFIDIIHYDEQDKVKEHIKLSSKNSNFKKPIDFRARHTDGHFIWFEALTSSAYTENDKNMFVTIARDITESVLIEEEIKEYQESLQKLTTEITLVEENQKKEIATNIHDHLSQSLVISNMKVKELKQKENLKEINEELNFIEEHISDALANSRKITSELSPPILYQFGIIEALYWLLENIENKHKIKCDINNNVESFKLDDVSSILLYRSIQEIINNTIKYAQATLITIDILKKKKGLEFVIKDNGKGFDVGNLNNLRKQNGSGFGLFTVKERIRNIRGKFKIASKINKGTIVHIFIPLKNE